MTVMRTPTGPTLRIALPFVAKSDIDLARLRQRGDELVVTVGSYRRLLALPAALSRFAVAGARVEDGALVVRFVAEPAPGGRTGDWKDGGSVNVVAYDEQDKPIAAR